jgi:hypothetical protein
MIDKEKKFEDLTAEDCKDLDIVFAPGCFDSFEGSQDELDEMIAEITQMIKSGKILENSQPLDVDNLDPEDLEKLLPFLVDFDEDTVVENPKRILN